ncbi:MAG: cell division protein FtsA [Candidatus Brennerbacteria bacterium CG_4_9_14_3_um_filter_43_9]|uniref:Cell division protein FtsA n=1 Tax=Candidatus Brennerbacteria bacterium CG_4_9_14_3_um_filter_43_9 TaxID=1974522 RepID=A0A2M8C3M7_9BACT|nr:MAG: cell division protein FtsA [Candidatus Brennerbacteria bacterium CG_4_9_14_3_um_filter_43_9]
MTRNKVLAAIDVGSSKIAVLIGQQNENNERINVLGASSVPSLGIRKGQIVNIEEASEVIIKAVEAAERMAGLSIGRILVSVGGAHISSQNSHGVVAVANPEGEIVHEDIKRAIEAARAISLPSSREILHVIPRTYTVDSQQGVADPIGMSGVRLEVDTHIITGSTTAVKNLSKCIAEVGADIGDLVFSGIASAGAVLTETEKELGVILLDIGGGTTSIIVFVENAPSYTAVLPIGSKNVTNDLAIGLRLSLDGAEKLKIALSEKHEEILAERGGNEKGDEIDLAKLGVFEETKTVSQKTLVEGIIRPRLNEIFNMVAVEIQKSGFAGLTPSGVVLTGGGALTVGASESCRRNLSLPVRVGIPGEISGLVDDILNPAFSVAIGLLFHGFKSGGEKSAGVFLPRFGGISHKIPLKGLFGKICSFVRSFLP